jgi:hypothetical protein
MFFSFHRLITVLFCHTVWTVQLIKRWIKKQSSVVPNCSL